MSVVYDEVPTVKKVALHYVCDVCSVGYATDSMEADEFLHVRRVGGYPSRFGDGSSIEMDICDSCQWTLFGHRWAAKEDAP